ncbi:MAG: hypothetical protein FWE53_05210 [Firmicutes bacterium]|nr:hypothetical protein [Bacillota bacterium]
MIDIDFQLLTGVKLGKTKLTEQDFAGSKVVTKKAHSEVAAMQKRGLLEWAGLPYSIQNQLTDIKRAAIGYRKYNNFIVIGAGRAVEGAKALTAALLNPAHNSLPREIRRAPRLYIINDTCPSRLYNMLAGIDLRDTVFNIVASKDEAAVMAQFLIIKKTLEDKLGKKAKEHIVVTTTAGSGAMSNTAKQEQYKMFTVAKGINGPFAALTSSSLLPLSVAGVDIDELLRGARDECEANRSDNIEKNLALKSAFTNYHFISCGKSSAAVLPFCSRLGGIANLYSGLLGQLNIAAHFAADLGGRHNMLQLLLGAANDKFAVFVAAKEYLQDLTAPENTPAGFEQLAGISLGELSNMEHKAAASVLAAAGKPNYTVKLLKTDAASIGRLVQMFMFQTAYTAQMLGIDLGKQCNLLEAEQHKLLCERTDSIMLDN